MVGRSKRSNSSRDILMICTIFFSTKYWTGVSTSAKLDEHLPTVGQITKMFFKCWPRVEQKRLSDLTSSTIFFEKTTNCPNLEYVSKIPNVTVGKNFQRKESSNVHLIRSRESWLQTRWSRLHNRCDYGTAGYRRPTYWGSFASRPWENGPKE